MKRLSYLIAFAALLIIFPAIGKAAGKAKHYFFNAGFSLKYINGQNDEVNLLSPFFSKIVDYGNCGAEALRADPWGLSLKSKWFSGLSFDLGYAFSQKLSLAATFAGYFKKMDTRKLNGRKRLRGVVPDTTDDLIAIRIFASTIGNWHLNTGLSRPIWQLYAAMPIVVTIVR